MILQPLFCFSFSFFFPPSFPFYLQRRFIHNCFSFPFFFNLTSLPLLSLSKFFCPKALKLLKCPLMAAAAMADSTLLSTPSNSQQNVVNKRNRQSNQHPKDNSCAKDIRVYIVLLGKDKGDNSLWESCLDNSNT